MHAGWNTHLHPSLAYRQRDQNQNGQGQHLPSTSNARLPERLASCNWQHASHVHAPVVAEVCKHYRHDCIGALPVPYHIQVSFLDKVKASQPEQRTGAAMGLGTTARISKSRSAMKNKRKVRILSQGSGKAALHMISGMTLWLVGKVEGKRVVGVCT